MEARELRAARHDPQSVTRSLVDAQYNWRLDFLLCKPDALALIRGDVC